MYTARKEIESQETSKDHHGMTETGLRSSGLAPEMEFDSWIIRAQKGFSVRGATCYTINFFARIFDLMVEILLPLLETFNINCETGPRTRKVIN